MGAYLTHPNLEKVSEDGGNEVLRYGASAMQGWRLAQEDAHNCLTNLDSFTALFGVYDGHGGSEVAIYTGKHLPGVIKNTKAYKDGDLGKSLEDSFMKFDAQLKEDGVIDELKQIAGIDNVSDAEEDEVENLQEEATLPLGELLNRFGMPTNKNQRALRKKANRTDLLSPVVTNKRTVFPDFDEDDESESTEKNVNGENKKTQESDSEKKKLFSDEDGEEEDRRGKSDKDESENANNSSVKTTSGHSREGRTTHCNGNRGKEEEADEVEQDEEWKKSSRRKAKAAKVVSEEEDEDEEDEDEEEEEDDDEDDDEEEDEEEDGNDRVMVQQTSEEPGCDSGTTACVVLIRGKEIVVGNVGDSRCVLSRDGEAVDLSVDHKPEDDTELQRIEYAGGKVTLDGRVNGGLNLSRALGDHCYKTNESLPPKDQMISAFPDLQTAAIKEEDDFLVIACDGIWNAMTSQEVVDFVGERLESEDDIKLSSVCEELFDLCLAPDTSGDGTGCDNMTCIIIKLNHYKTSSDPGSKRKAQKEEAAEVKRPKN